MSASRWMRKWKNTSAQEERTGALVHASVRGDSLHQLLDLAVQALLEAASADRVGLWLTGERRGDTGWGRVVESKRGPVPEQWKHFDISTPFLRSALESPEPLRVELGRDDTMPHLGPLVGMRGAIWIPLRAGNRTLGLAMVGYFQSQAASHLDLEPLRARADEVALAVAHHYDSRR
jgi:GAF domain-containing protein